jgi:hypothetical protein
VVFVPGTEAPLVSPGDYLVSITVGGKTLKQRLRVERATNGTPVIASPDRVRFAMRDSHPGALHAPGLFVRPSRATFDRTLQISDPLARLVVPLVLR